MTARWRPLASCLSAEDANALPVGAARALLCEHVRAIGRRETLPLMQAVGRVLSEAIIAPISVPAADNSAMDGYALNGALLAETRADGTVTCRVVGRALAGHPFDGAVEGDACVRIMTGAVMPAGADTVIPHEYCVPAAVAAARPLPAGQTGDTVTLAVNTFRRGANRRLIGEDIAAGTVILQKGRVLRASDIGLLASMGLAAVDVFARLRVAFFSTGDELQPVGAPLAQGAVYDSNRYTLHAMLTRLGVEAIDLGVVRDTAAALRHTLDRAIGCADAIISSGGVSAGDADFVRDVFSECGDIVFWKLAMRPGRPFAFGLLGEDAPIPFFGLPGNPVAVMACFYHLVRAPLLQAMGATPSAPPRVTAYAAKLIRKRPGRTEFARAIATRLPLRSGEPGSGMPAEAWQVELTGAQGSGVLSSMSAANCFVVLEHERGDIAPGEPVDMMFFEGLI